MNNVVADEKGMLWMDKSAAPLEKRVLRAAEHFKNKRAVKPGRILVPAGELAGEIEIDGIRIIPADNIHAHHMQVYAGSASRRAIEETS